MVTGKTKVKIELTLAEWCTILALLNNAPLKEYQEKLEQKLHEATFKDLKGE